MITQKTELISQETNNEEFGISLKDCFDIFIEIDQWMKEIQEILDRPLFLEIETKATSKPKAKATSKPKAKATSKPKAKATSKPKAKATPKPKAKATPKPKAKATPKPKIIAEFVIFDNTPQGQIQIKTLRIPVLKSGKISDKNLAKLESHSSIRNRTIQGTNEAAMTVLKPWNKNKNIVLTPDIVTRLFELAVEEGIEIELIPFKISNEFKVQVSSGAIRNALYGKTHKNIQVPRNLRAKFLKMIEKNPELIKGSSESDLETRISVILKIEHGKSGREAAEGIVTSSTANTWHRKFFGQYRNGPSIPECDLPKWVFEARKQLKERLEQGEKIKVNDRIRKLLGLE